MKIGFASADWSHTVKDDRGHPVWGGSGWARLGQYQKLLPFDIVVGVLAFKNGHFGVLDWNRSLHLDCDIVYMQRVMFADVPDRILQARANGQIIINDIDDWYWGLSPANGAWKASHPKSNPQENINHYKSVLGRSSIVTVSTPYLADRISKFVSCPIVLIPNFVETDKFTVREQTPGNVPIVGWVGSTSHRSGDIETMRGILGDMTRRKQIKLHHSGHLQGAKTFASGLGLEDDLVTTLPMAAPKEYPDLFQFDVGIVPLSSAPFNEAKSAIKGLEYAAAGIPFVAQATSSYKALAENGIGIAASKSKQWIKHLSMLRDCELRVSLGVEYRALVKEKYDVSIGAALLTQFFNQVQNAL